jgi:hypothetical protein
VKINIANLVRSEASLLKNFHTPISEVERLPYWQFELLISELERMVKEENEQNQQENGTMSQNSMMKSYNNSMSQMQRRMSSSMPSFSTPKMPKI